MQDEGGQLQTGRLLHLQQSDRPVGIGVDRLHILSLPLLIVALPFGQLFRVPLNQGRTE